MPTLYVREGGTGGGKASLFAAGDLVWLLYIWGSDQRLALRSGDTFTALGPFRIDAFRTSVIGGYVECAPGRWVRDPLGRSTLSALDGGAVLQINTSTSNQPLEDVTLSNLELKASACCGSQLEATNVVRLTVDNILGRFSGGTGGLIRMTGGSGLIQRTRVEPQPNVSGQLIAIEVGPGSGALEIVDSEITAAAGTSVIGIQATGRSNLRLANNVFDYSASLALSRSIGISIDQARSTVVEGNTITLPSVAFSTGITSVISFGLEIRDNRIVGGGGGAVTGLYLDGSAITPGEPVRVSGNTIDVRGAGRTAAILIEQYVADGLVLTDNVFRARGSGVCSSSYVTAMTVYSERLRAERNRFFADRGGFVEAVQISGGEQIELDSNHFWVGESTCPGYSSAALDIGGLNTRVYLRGNTIDPQGGPVQGGITRGIRCTQAARLIADGNLVGGGTGINHAAVADYTTAQSCSDRTDWHSNYFWYDDASGAPNPGDNAMTIVVADAGQRDVRGNIFNFNISCFEDAGVTDAGSLPRYRLAAGSPCVDTGQQLLRQDGGVIDLDIDRLSRSDAGPPDVGCSERH